MIIRWRVGRKNHDHRLLRFFSEKSQTQGTDVVGVVLHRSKPSDRLQSKHERPSLHSHLNRSPRRPRKTKIWLENGVASCGVCTDATMPVKPRGVSVTPAAIQIRGPTKAQSPHSCCRRVASLWIRRASYA